MTSKIIKQGSSRASEIQQISFCDSGPETQTIPEQVHWPEVSVSPPPQKNKSEFVDVSKPEIDMALLERTAFENGLRQGEKAGAAMAEAKIEELMKRHAETILEIGRMKASLYAKVEREVAKLSIAVAQKIVHREIQIDKDIIHSLVHVALTHVMKKTPVVVHVNPADYEYLSTRQADLSQAESRNVSLVSDKSIERGGCLIETDSGDIDARLEEKFREVERTFFEGGS
jgi:flagellar biosynthesis/type III secretory pathway protein FliH